MPPGVALTMVRLAFLLGCSGGCSDPARPGAPPPEPLEHSERQESDRPAAEPPGEDQAPTLGGHPHRAARQRVIDGDTIVLPIGNRPERGLAGCGPGRAPRRPSEGRRHGAGPLRLPAAPRLAARRRRRPHLGQPAAGPRGLRRRPPRPPGATTIGCAARRSAGWRSGVASDSTTAPAIPLTPMPASRRHPPTAAATRSRRAT